MVGEMCWSHGRRIEENNCLRETEKRNERERERERWMTARARARMLEKNIYASTNENYIYATL